MRQSPMLLLLGAGLLVAVPYALIRAGEAFSAGRSPDSTTPGVEPPAESGATLPRVRDEPAAHEAPAAPSDLSAETGMDGPRAMRVRGAINTPSSARLTAEAFAELALASDVMSLDQDVGMNADFRDHGVGLVPRVLSINAAEKSVRLRARAIGAVFRLPFGWYAADNDRRTLVFDDDGRIQITLSLHRSRGTPVAAYVRGLVQPCLEREPGLAVATFQLEEEIAGAAVHGVEIDGEFFDQIYLARPAERPNQFLVARITARGDHSRRAVNLAGDILAGLEPGRELVAQN